MKITKRMEFDAGHRLPFHNSKCAHLHGHRYVLEVTLVGSLNQTPQTSDQDMLLDFSQVKLLMKEHIVEPWDHAFLVYQEDTKVLEFLNSLPNHKTVVLDAVPTVESLAQKAFDTLAPLIQEKYKGRVQLDQVRLYETPTCWATVNESSKALS